MVQSIFERSDKDRSGRIDESELRDALLSLGFSVSPVILDLLVSKFDKSGGKNRAIEYDNFIEYVIIRSIPSSLSLCLLCFDLLLIIHSALP